MNTLQEFKQTLEYHDVLNPKLFCNYKLKDEIKTKLLQIAELFRIDCNLSKDLVDDCHAVGGNFNFNYTSQSDLDVHLIVDYNKINSGTIDLADYFKAKKESWSDNHTITIAGYPVELYVQDSSSKLPTNQGCYSLYEHKFIIMPKRVKVDYDDPKLHQKIESYIRKIDNANDIVELTALKNKLKDMRMSGLVRGGEFSEPNLIFKSLRNLGYLDILQNKYKKIRDRELSL